MRRALPLAALLLWCAPLWAARKAGPPGPGRPGGPARVNPPATPPALPAPLPALPAPPPASAGALPAAPVPEAPAPRAAAPASPLQAPGASPAQADEADTAFAQLSREVERLRREKDAKDALIASISHDFLNALNSVHLPLQLLERGDAIPEAKRRELFGMMHARLQTLADWTHNFLALASTERDEAALRPAPLDPAAALREAAALAAPLAERKRISLELRPVEGMVTADPAALSRILANLVGNAVKYTPPGGSVVLGAQRDPSLPGRLLLFVEDTGIGIKPDDIPRILGGRDYYRTPEAKRSGEPGFGVGLALARRLIEAHQSWLMVQSAPGRGSRFFFPLAEAGPAGADQARSQ